MSGLEESDALFFFEGKEREFALYQALVEQLRGRTTRLAHPGGQEPDQFVRPAFCSAQSRCLCGARRGGRSGASW